MRIEEAAQSPASDATPMGRAHRAGHAKAKTVEIIVEGRTK